MLSSSTHGPKLPLTGLTARSRHPSHYACKLVVKVIMTIGPTHISGGLICQPLAFNPSGSLLC